MNKKSPASLREAGPTGAQGLLLLALPALSALAAGCGDLAAGDIDVAFPALPGAFGALASGAVVGLLAVDGCAPLGALVNDLAVDVQHVAPPFVGCG